jgi:hypothetical protein
MNAFGPLSTTGGIVALAGVIGIFAVPIVAIACNCVGAIFKTWQEVGLKRDMVARGYTAQEIVEVVAAKRGTKSKSTLPNVPPAKPIKQPALMP